jgi:hypothetical protein
MRLHAVSKFIGTSQRDFDGDVAAYRECNCCCSLALQFLSFRIQECPLLHVNIMQVAVTKAQL